MEGIRWSAGMRRIDTERRPMLLFAGGVCLLTCGAGLLLPLTQIPIAHPDVLATICVVGLVGGTSLLATLFASDERLLATLDPVALYTALVLALVVINTGIYALGPSGLGHLLFGAFLVPAIFAVYLLRRPLAWAYLLAIAIVTGLIVMLQPGWTIGPFIWLAAMVYLVFSALIVAGIVEKMDDAGRAEHQANARLADLNATLQQRVEEQVDELGRLGQLRRFLSPQLADVVLSAGSENILRPHRKEIAVFFADLRSYTRFTVSEAPEDVLTSLDEYYAIVCSVLQRHNATIGNFTGDGVMAFLNDPLDHADPAGGAVSIALEFRDEMAPLVDRWTKRGFNLGYGVGIAVGYATLGLLGNDQRSDYTAVGPAVNLAARLCGDAQNGQILIDHRTRSAVDAWVRTEALEPVTLKGFPEPVPAYSVVGTGSA